MSNLPPFEYTAPANIQRISSHNPKQTIVNLYRLMAQVKAITDFINTMPTTPADSGKPDKSYAKDSSRLVTKD